MILNRLPLPSASRWLLGISLCASALAAHAALPIEHWTHANGAKIWLVESTSLPMVDLRLTFDAGARRDPAKQAGLAEATAAMLLKGVTAGGGKKTAMDEDQLGQAWADLGAQFAASADGDAFQISLRSLTEPALLQGAVSLAARQIAHPAWPNNVWERDRQRWISALAEARTRPITIAREAFDLAVYGSHPYGQHVTPETLAAISTRDMRQFYQAHVQPCHATVTVVGHVTRAQTDNLVEQLLAGLASQSASKGQTPAHCTPAAPVAEVEPLKQPSEQKIAIAVEQTTIIVGQPGIKRDDPDFMAMLVGNHILGSGGFTSRLMHEVREKRGLVYGIHSDFAPGRHAGAFSIFLQTRNEQAEQALQVVRNVLHNFVANGPTEEELQAAKDNLIGGFALRIDSNAKLLGNITNIAWNNLPLTYLDTWTQQVAALTTEDIKRAFQKHLQPAQMATVIAGGAQ